MTTTQNAQRLIDHYVTTGLRDGGWGTRDRLLTEIADDSPAVAYAEIVDLISNEPIDGATLETEQDHADLRTALVEWHHELNAYKTMRTTEQIWMDEARDTAVESASSNRRGFSFTYLYHGQQDAAGWAEASVIGLDQGYAQLQKD
jgi:hypothetical protein